jgi:hypothetical protein
MSDNLLTRKYPNLNHVGVVVRDIDLAERDNSNRFGLSTIARRFTLHIENALYQVKLSPSQPNLVSSSWAIQCLSWYSHLEMIYPHILTHFKREEERTHIT